VFVAVVDFGIVIIIIVIVIVILVIIVFLCFFPLSSYLSFSFSVF